MNDFRSQIFPRSYSQVSQILELRQVRQFKIKRVHHEPSIDRDGNDYYPQHRHGDVVEENQIVDNGEEQKSEESESDENSVAPQPWNDFRFVFLWKIEMNIYM
jgi:hypothetical protein